MSDEQKKSDAIQNFVETLIIVFATQPQYRDTSLQRAALEASYHVGERVRAIVERHDQWDRERQERELQQQKARDKAERAREARAEKAAYARLKRKFERAS